MWGFTAGELQADEAGFSGMDSAASALAAAMSLSDRTPRTPFMRLKGVSPLHLPFCFFLFATLAACYSEDDAPGLATLLTGAPVQGL